MVDYMPVGSVMTWYSHVSIPAGWLPADGRRLRKRDDPILYNVLKKRWHRGWRPWVVFLPNFNAGSNYLYIIKAGR